jgi:hypothetical protein
MPAEYRLVVHCKNPACRYTTSLPYSIPADKNVTPHTIPTELFPLRVLCRKCAHWFVYLAQEAEWGGFPTRRPPEHKLRPTSWILEAECAVPECESLTRWHVGDDSGIEASYTMLLLANAQPTVVCEHHHNLIPEPRRFRAIHPLTLQPPT